MTFRLIVLSVFLAASALGPTLARAQEAMEEETFEGYMQALDIAARIDAFSVLCREDVFFADQILTVATSQPILPEQADILAALRDKSQSEQLARLKTQKIDCDDTDSLLEKYALVRRLGEVMGVIVEMKKARRSAGQP